MSNTRVGLYMQPDQIKQVLESSLNAQHVAVEIDGSHVKVVVVSEQFDGLSPVKKQQLVYACLQDAIASGAIHAVHMQTLTPAQWASQNS